MDEQLTRNVPYSLEAEQGVLGCMIKNSAALSRVMELQLHANDFYFEQHKIIFDALSHLFLENVPLDLIVLSGELKDNLEKLVVFHTLPRLWTVLIQQKT